VNAYRCSCFAMTELRRWLAGDCERFKAAKAHGPCGCHFLELPALFGPRSLVERPKALEHTILPRYRVRRATTGNRTADLSLLGC
jgi:hypothetical protein